jgi:hypothetical protein
MHPLRLLDIRRGDLRWRPALLPCAEVDVTKTTNTSKQTEHKTHKEPSTNKQAINHKKHTQQQSQKHNNNEQGKTSTAKQVQ